MKNRILWGCVAALGLLTLFALLTFVFHTRLNQALMTPLGELPLLDLFGVLVAMTVGGAIAGPRFRWIAVALISAVWLLSVFVLSRAPNLSMVGVVKYNLLAIVLNLVLAWGGAILGPQLLARYRARRAAH
ncbi:hypothetical protein [Lysobacter panacisoli]|uniref:Uncharacterized protein n=1 Tax=Lysobacter panacisoli TaxID=1255263 RepID=A0ABP9KXL1_9GAMM|nr:hypothetical protein [Lysobacter panacisoli]